VSTEAQSKEKIRLPDMNGLVEEACSFLVGGSDTTGLTLQAVVLLILRNPGILDRLREELDATSEFIGREFEMQLVSKLPRRVRLFPSVMSPMHG
jgi:cytochrome P450